MNAAPSRFRKVIRSMVVCLALLGTSPVVSAQTPEQPPILSPDVQPTGHSQGPRLCARVP